MSKCDKLHVGSKGAYVVVSFNRFRIKKRAYFCILPSARWKAFRSAGFQKAHFEETHRALKSTVGVRLMDARKPNFYVVPKAISAMEADTASGHTQTVSGQHYAMFEPDALANKNAEAYDSLTSKCNIIR
jgi:hypothetical protein